MPKLCYWHGVCPFIIYSPPPPISLGALTSPWHYFFRKGFLKEVFMLLLVLLLRVQLSSPSGLFCPQPVLAGGMRTPTPRLREDYSSRGLGS